MGWEIVQNRFWCNTSDEFLSPQLDCRVFSNDVAVERFVKFLKVKYKTSDPRDLKFKVLESALSEFANLWLSGDISLGRVSKSRKNSLTAGGALTKEVAGIAVKKKDFHSLYLFRLIEDDAAVVLSKIRDYISLHLTGIKELSLDSARSLSSFEGRVLELNGLKSVSEDVAAALANFSGTLLLDGLSVITDGVAAKLGRFKGHGLSLNGLTSLSDAAASSLGRLAGRRERPQLFLNRVQALTDSASDSLSGFKQDDLELGSLSKISSSAALKLGRLSLVSNLSGKDVKSLESAMRRFKGDTLDLNGLRSLDPVIAGVISKFKGCELKLDGLRELDAELLKELVKTKVDAISLKGLTKLTGEAADMLLRFKGEDIILGSPTIPMKAKERLEDGEFTVIFD